MDQGHIVEEGTRRTPVAKDGLYAWLAKLQFDGHGLTTAAEWGDHVIASAAQQAKAGAFPFGLLRCARNDGVAMSDVRLRGCP